MNEASPSSSSLNDNGLVGLSIGQVEDTFLFILTDSCHWTGIEKK